MPEDSHSFEDDHNDRSARLTNDDFRRLLMTPRGSVPATPSVSLHVSGNRDRDGPKSSISMAPPSMEVEDKAERRRKKKSFYAKLKKQEEDKMAELAEKYRDRAKERREGANPDYQAEDPVSGSTAYRAVAPDVKSGLDAAERRRQMIQESKFLGGDMEHTHLVKGLDFALLQKVRSEIQLRENEDEQLEKLVAVPIKKKERVKEDNDELQFRTKMGRAVHHLTVGFAQKGIERNELFAPGRMAYCIDLDDELADSDIPTTLIRSKADCPLLEQSANLTTNDIVINKLAQILSYLRHGRHGKKGKRKDKEKGKEKGKLGEDSIYGDIGDYVPDVSRDKKKYKEGARKKGSYFDKPEEEPQKESWEAVRPKASGSSTERKDRFREVDSVTAAKNAAQLLTKLAAEPEGYAECYPGLDEMQDAIDDSDDEVDYTKMDLGNKKGPIGRWDFDTQEEYSQYMNNKEALPKAAFQYGVKMADGRRTRTKNKEKNEKQQLDREWNKIQNIIQKRKGDKDGGPEFKMPKY